MAQETRTHELEKLETIINYQKIKRKHRQLDLLVLMNCEYGVQQVNNNNICIYTPRTELYNQYTQQNITKAATIET